jgi:hypothetical protein
MSRNSKRKRTPSRTHSLPTGAEALKHYAKKQKQKDTIMALQLPTIHAPIMMLELPTIPEPTFVTMTETETVRHFTVLGHLRAIDADANPSPPAPTRQLLPKGSPIKFDNNPMFTP